MRAHEQEALGAQLRNPVVLTSLMLVAEPLDPIPSAAVRRALRQAVGVGPHVRAAVLLIGAETFGRWERADVCGPVSDLRTFGGRGRDDYARLLAVFRAWLQAHRPDLLADIEEN